MFYLNLPLLCDNSKFNYAFEQFILHHQDKLNIPIYIESMCGSFPYSSWNGGVNSNFGKDLLYQDLNAFITKMKTPIRLDCSNILLDETDFFDRHQNVILQLMESKGNLIEIADLRLYDYIEKHYKNYNYVISNNINCIHPVNESIINGFLNNNKIALLTLNNINNIDLKLIKHIMKIELVISNPCQYCSEETQANCLKKEQNNQLVFSIKSIYDDCSCKNYNIYNDTHYLLNEIQHYAEFGIHHFKIFPPDLNQIEAFNRFIVFNLVKPEYYNFCFSYLDKKIKE